jgi:hypothetical protein
MVPCNFKMPFYVLPANPNCMDILLSVKIITENLFFHRSHQKLVSQGKNLGQQQ